MTRVCARCGQPGGDEAWRAFCRECGARLPRPAGEGSAAPRPVPAVPRPVPAAPRPVPAAPRPVPAAPEEPTPRASARPAPPTQREDAPARAAGHHLGVVGGLAVVVVCGFVALAAVFPPLANAVRGRSSSSGSGDGSTSAGGWVTVTSPDGDFSVSLPRRPRTARGPIADPVVAGAVHALALDASSGDHHVLVLREIFSSSVPVSRLSLLGGAVGAVRALVGEAVGTWSAHDLTVQGRPGLDAVLDGSGSNPSARVRVVIDGARRYAVAMVSADPTRDGFARLAGSFRLLGR